jgi:hypothetical protein
MDPKTGQHCWQFWSWKSEPGSTARPQVWETPCFFVMSLISSTPLVSAVLVQLMQNYFQRIGDKACCFEDLKPYLELGPDDLISWNNFLDSIPSSCASLPGYLYSPDVPLTSFSQSEPTDLQRTINAFKLSRHGLSEADLTVELEVTKASLFVTRYLEGLQNVGTNLPATELQPADDLAILAGHVFISLWTLTGDESHLFSAAAVLEFALSRSKQAFQIRLILIRIYRLLGMSPNFVGAIFSPILLYRSPFTGSDPLSPHECEAYPA